MNRSLVTLAGLSLVALVGTVTPATVRDASAIDPPRTPGNNRDGVSVARGEDGDTITYTINEQPDVAAPPPGTVVPAAPDLSRVPVDPNPDPVLAPAAGPVVSETTTDTVAPVVSDAPVTVPATGAEAAPAVVVCSDFPSWYDAQIYYESIGQTAAAAEVVASLDPDFNGVACEEIIQPQ